MVFPPIFFLKVRHQRTAPIWRHLSLKLLDDENDDTMVAQPTDDCGSHTDRDSGPFEDDDVEDDDEDDLVDTGSGGQTFEEAMRSKIRTLKAITEGLEYQVQFRDHRLLQGLEKEGASFFRLAVACLSKEKRMQMTRGGVPSTWEQSTSTAMFYRSRPAQRSTSQN
ncbi:hypothetical protein C0991_010276 [Blastosporella zonata]|nr:hypothetical protein C0991_010276 [Blastosporella zonata]